MSQYSPRNPLPHPYPKPKRLPERNAVTIVAGFKCNEGLVLCADTQETIENTKMRTPKLRVEPNSLPVRCGIGVDSSDDLMVAFAGAGMGPFLDKLVDRAWKDAQTGTDIESVASAIEESIKSAYKEYGEILQDTSPLWSTLLYGIKMHGQSGLFSAEGPFVNDKSSYVSAGSGLHLANFISRRMYIPAMTLRQAVILAAYVLFQSKEHVVGCGGDSHIAVLRNAGNSSFVDSITLKGINEQIEQIDVYSEKIILYAADLEISEDRYQQEAIAFFNLITGTRKLHKTTKENWDRFSEALSGLGKPAESQE